MKKVLTFLCLFLVCLSYAKDKDELLEVSVESDVIYLQPTGEYANFVLTISGPGNAIYKLAFDGFETPMIDLLDSDGVVLPDGTYSYTMVAAPIIEDETRALMREARLRGETIKGTPTGKSQMGHFSILDGEFVIPDQEEPQLFSVSKDDSLDGETYTVIDEDIPGRDQQILDDLIVAGSGCFGLDCVNGESFGFDTIRLKENNLRIKFQDTSVSASFPSNDWQITANDSGNGGGNFLAFDDIDGGRTPFKVEASAPTASLYVDDGGRIGLGTATPVVELHVVNGDSPTLRLEQDGSSGFTPQTWDVAGNETNYFVRDASNGSRLPFKIRPSAPTNSIFVDTDGDVGLGTASPAAALHVESGTTRLEGDTTIEGDDVGLVITDTRTTAANRNLIELTNYGNTKVLFNNTADSGASASSTGQPWELVYGNNGQMYFFQQGNANRAWEVYGDGTVFVNQVLTHGSDVNIKENIEAIEPIAVLDQVLDLPITTWNYKTNCDDVKHMGPMAQDFYSIFGLNNSETGVTSTDTSGVALGAIQGLNQKLILEVETKDAEIKELREKLDAQEARLRALEAALLK